MSDHEFLFALRVAESDEFDELLGDLAASVMRHVGCADGAIAELSRQLRANVAEGRAAGAAYDVEFRAHAGEIEITVLQGDRPIFQTSRRLP